MDKDIITIEAIREDLYRIVKWQSSIICEWRLSLIGGFSVIAILLGLIFRSLWVGIAVFSVVAYQIVRFILAYKEILAKKKAVRNISKRADISISTRPLSHIAQTVIHEPQLGYRGHVNTYKEVTMYYFDGSFSWRSPGFGRYYNWSENHTVLVVSDGDVCYCVSLQGYHDVAYIYPCKHFDLDGSLKEVRI